MPPHLATRRRSLICLLDGAGVQFSCSQSLAGINIIDIADDSRRVTPRSLFVAIKGEQYDGHDFVSQVIDAGAAAVMLSEQDKTDPRVPCLLVADPRDALAKLAAAYAGLPNMQAAGEMSVVGVTGTNGKSTTCHLLRDILHHASYPAALLGTIGYDLIGRQLQAPWTTPPALPLATYLVEAHAHGARYAVMEVSSHALDQRRTNGVRFDVAVFTNLSGDHLDYHPDPETYFHAKKRLFDELSSSSTAVINVDDAHGEQIIRDCKARVIRFGLEAPADVVAQRIECDIHTSRFDLIVEAHQCPVVLPLIGRHNVSNALAAAAAASACGIAPTIIQEALNNPRTVSGRLQRAEPPGHPFSVFVDYAHTDDALDNVLATLRPLTSGKLWCVFGCGGDRDKSKRPRMAGVASAYADRIVVTSDNPRSEAPLAIINDILPGLNGRSEIVSVEENRRRGIHLALTQAEPGDVILIAGKGHESYQLIGDQCVHFNDVEVVHEFFAKHDQIDGGAEPLSKGRTSMHETSSVR